MPATDPQLWRGRSGQPLEKERLRPIRPRYPGRTFVKPFGGLWTSTYHERFGGGWVQWCINEEWECPDDGVFRNLWLAYPRADANVYVIDSLDDLVALNERFGAPAYPEWKSSFMEAYPDWLKVAEHYDGVNLTDRGQWQTRLAEPNLYGWDCESTLWFRWCFERVEQLGDRKFVYEEDDAHARA